jgi:hypothetical protein
VIDLRAQASIARSARSTATERAGPTFRHIPIRCPGPCGCALYRRCHVPFCCGCGRAERRWRRAEEATSRCDVSTLRNIAARHERQVCRVRSGCAERRIVVGEHVLAWTLLLLPRRSSAVTSGPSVRRAAVLSDAAVRRGKRFAGDLLHRGAERASPCDHGGVLARAAVERVLCGV